MDVSIADLASSKGFRAYAFAARMREQHRGGHSLRDCAKSTGEYGDRGFCYGNHPEWTRYREEYNALTAERVTEQYDSPRWVALDASWCPECKSARMILTSNAAADWGSCPIIEIVECGNCGHVMHYENKGYARA